MILNLTLRISLVVLAMAGLSASYGLFSYSAVIERSENLRALILAGSPVRAIDAASLATASRHVEGDTCSLLKPPLSPTVLAWLADNPEQLPQQHDEPALRISHARAAARGALRCAPHDATALLVYLRFSILEDGLGEAQFRLVDYLHRIAPREAWIQNYRLALLVPIYGKLGPAQQRHVRVDLHDLIRSEQIMPVVMLLRAASPELQDDVARSLAPLPLGLKRKYQSLASRMGIRTNELDIPRRLQ